MRISHITKSLLLSLVVLSCTARQENSTDKSAEADTKDKSPSQVEEFVRFIKTGGIDIPLKFYSLLRMDTAQDTDYAIAASAMNVEPMFVLLSKTAGCTDITCSLHYRAYNISTSEENKQTRVHFCGEFEEAFETNPPVYALSYGMFVLMEDTVHDWEESDSGAMSEVSEAYEKDYIYAYYNDEIKSIESLDKGALRILRNYIFARYHYKFKSQDLLDYFSQYDWYKPVNDNVDNQLSDTDKKLIAIILARENS